jgi:hypothetical protein
MPTQAHKRILPSARLRKASGYIPIRLRRWLNDGWCQLSSLANIGDFGSASWTSIRSKTISLQPEWNRRATRRRIPQPIPNGDSAKMVYTITNQGAEALQEAGLSQDPSKTE